METDKSTTTPEAQASPQNPTPSTPPPSSDTLSGKVLIIFAFVILLVAGGAFVMGQKTAFNKNTDTSPTPTPSAISDTPSPTSQTCTEDAKRCPDGSFVGRTGPNCAFAPCPGSNTSTSPTKAATTPGPQVNGANLENIKYTLPTGWKAEIRTDDRLGQKILSIYPTNGGYFGVAVYDYNGTTGRREFYCQKRDVCQSSSTFTDIPIGNITGYKANAIDNSGGGPEYFGAKGNKFYIISSYTPPSPNDFEKHSQEVLNSLIF